MVLKPKLLMLTACWRMPFTRMPYIIIWTLFFWEHDYVQVVLCPLSCSTRLPILYAVPPLYVSVCACVCVCVWIEFLHVQVLGKFFMYPRCGPVQTNQNQPNNNKCTLVTSISPLVSCHSNANRDLLAHTMLFTACLDCVALFVGKVMHLR